MSEILWRPDESAIAASNMTKFTRYLAEDTGIQFSNYDALHKWSIENIEAFWENFVDFTCLIYSRPHEQVLDSHKMPGARWFAGMELNYAENIFARNFDNIAVRYYIEKTVNKDEYGHYSGEYTYEELRILVARCARGLRNAGVHKGDKVAGYLANVSEAIIACLACASIGAIWSSASPDFGLEAVVDRFQQVEPKLIFASTHYRYNGRTFHTDKVVNELKNKIPSIETIISVPYPVGHYNISGDKTWQEFLGPDDKPELTFAQVPFEHPLFILFSSGTTGPPKCIVHGTGGTLLQHRKELSLHSNIKANDSLLFFTTCGWMMWNWQLSALSLGATICLYDGNPGYPDLTAIWQVVDKSKITHFGTSGRFIEACMKHRPAIKPGKTGEFRALSTLLYTGSPLSADGFRWVYTAVKKDHHLAGISGGTDIISCFVLGNPNLPVIAGEIQCKGLGIDVVAFDEEGNVTKNQPGELVCRKPIPSMPIEFLNDADGKRYHDAYFDIYPGLWRHGDFVQFTPSGGVIVFGRSDATLNPGGIRIGSAEIYSALDKIDWITGSVVVGWNPPNQSDEIIILFIVLPAGKTLDESFQKTIRETLRNKRSPRHIPKHIFQISEVPVTRSGKTVELSVKAILAGKKITNKNALANPQVLEEINQARQKLLQLYS